MYRALVIALLVGLAPIAHAQFDTGDTLNVTIAPANPRPYDTVTVTPSSTLVDLAAATISISVNGKVVESGGGVQSVPVTVAGPGGSTSISITAKVDGQTYTKQVVLRPADVSLIVDPVSSVHPFYDGAPLVASTGRVRLIAIADLRSSPNIRIDPKNLVYHWKFGDKELADQSGIGRSVLEAVAPVRYRDAQITVDVSTTDSTIVAEASTVVSPTDPVVRIYPNDALAGPDFDHALTGSFAMNGAEQAFRGVSYFFAATPSLSWSVNSREASTNQDVTVRTTGSGGGTATISLSANESDTNQSASAQVPISFGSNTKNIFGF